MKVALIDASVPPLVRKGRKAKGNIYKTFIPCIDLMKAFAYCGREGIEARLLLYQEEMESATDYDVILISMENPASSMSSTVEYIVNVYKDFICSKSFFESLYDGHEGTDICITGDAIPAQYQTGSTLGAHVDACPCDADVYGEMLYVRNRLYRMKTSSFSGKILDTAYGRIMLEDGRWMGPVQMARFMGADSVEVADKDPSGISTEIMVKFIRQAVDGRIKLSFRHPFDMSRMSSDVVDAMDGLKVSGCVDVYNYDPESMKVMLMKLVDAVNRDHVRICINDIGKGAKSEKDHMEAVRGLLKSIYLFEIQGCRFRMELSTDARVSEYGALYLSVIKWCMAGSVPYMMPIGKYMELKKDEIMHVKSLSKDILDLDDARARLVKEYPDMEDLLDNFSITAARNGKWKFKGAFRCSKSAEPYRLTR